VGKAIHTIAVARNAKERKIQEFMMGIRNNERAAKFVVSKDWIVRENDQGDEESKEMFSNQ
jgi:hypothetical protein